jgi:glutathione S-transferase
MKLIGMMDSPYVRRVAVSLALYGVEFESLPLSVLAALTNFPVLIRWSRRRRWCLITGRS